MKHLKTNNGILNEIKKILENKHNCVFSVSNNVFQEDTKQLENAADNLFFTRIISFKSYGKK